MLATTPVKVTKRVLREKTRLEIFFQGLDEDIARNNPFPGCAYGLHRRWEVGAPHSNSIGGLGGGGDVKSVQTEQGTRFRVAG